jgi:hypothetical protein
MSMITLSTRRFTHAALLMGAAATMAIATPLQAQERVEVGIAAQTAGEVLFSATPEAKARKIARKERLAWGNMVTTKKKSQLQILLLDRSTVSLGASTQLVIDSFVYDPDKQRGFFGRILKGAFRFMSGLTTPDSTARIEAPAASIGIRGTVVDTVVGEEAIAIAKQEAAIPGNVKHDKKTATFVVMRGPGARTAPGVTPGRADVTGVNTTVALDGAGLAAYVPFKGAEPIGPFRISPEGMGMVQDELQPRVVEARSGGNGLLKALVGVAAVTTAAILLGRDGDKAPVAGTADTPNSPNNPPPTSAPPPPPPPKSPIG